MFCGSWKLYEIKIWVPISKKEVKNKAPGNTNI